LGREKCRGNGTKGERKWTYQRSKLSRKHLKAIRTEPRSEFKREEKFLRRREWRKFWEK